MDAAGAASQGMKGAHGAGTEPSTHATEQRGELGTAVAPSDNHDNVQNARDLKSSLKKHVDRAEHRDDGRSPTEVAGREDTLMTKATRDQEGDGSAGPGKRTRKRHHSKGGKLPRGKSKDAKLPEEPRKSKPPTSPMQNDGEPVGLAAAATSQESEPANRASSPSPGEHAAVDANAFNRPADGKPVDRGSSYNARETPPEMPRNACKERDGEIAVRDVKSVDARETTTAMTEFTERRKSKVAIMESDIHRAERNENSATVRLTSRRPSQYSRKDSVMWSTRRMDASWRSVVSGTASKVMRMALHRSEESQQSALSAEEQILLAAVGCALLLTFGVIMGGIAYLMSRARIGSAGMACETPECLKAKAYLAGLLNLGWDTCSGFYQYVCSSWTGGNSSFVEDVGNVLAVKLHDALMAVTSTGEDRLGRRVASDTYKACQKYVESETSLEEVLLSVSDFMNVSGIARAESFTELVDGFVKISLTFGFPSVMAVDFVNVSDQNVIVRISAGKSLASKLAYTDESQLEHTLTRILISSRTTDNVSEAVTSLVNLDIEMTQLLRQGHVRDDTGDLRKFFDGLVPGVKVDTWLSAMNSVLPPRLQLSNDDIAVGRGIDSVRGCFDKLGASGVSLAAAYFAASFQLEVAAIEKRKYLARKSRPRTIRFCLGLSQRAVAVTWHRIVSGMAAIDETADSLVKDLFHELQRMSDDPSVFTWLRYKSRQAATKVAHETSLTTGYHGLAASEEPAADYSYALTFRDPRHFVVDYAKALKKGQEARFQNPPTWIELTLSTIDPLGDVVYDPSLKLVVLPAVFLTEPILYATGVPMYYNYGILGVVLASQLARAVGQSSAIEVDAHGRPEPGRARRKRNVTLSCLRRLHERLGFGKSAPGLVGEQDDAMFALAQGVALAHANLAADFEAAVPDQDTYDSLWPEAQTTFFLRFCLWSCSASQHPSPLTPMERCLLPLHNMPDFAETFGCAGRSDFVIGGCRV